MASNSFTAPLPHDLSGGFVHKDSNHYGSIATMQTSHKIATKKLVAESGTLGSDVVSVCPSATIFSGLVKSPALSSGAFEQYIQHLVTGFEFTATAANAQTVMAPFSIRSVALVVHAVGVDSSLIIEPEVYDETSTSWVAAAYTAMPAAPALLDVASDSVYVSLLDSPISAFSKIRFKISGFLGGSITADDHVFVAVYVNA